MNVRERKEFYRYNYGLLVQNSNTLKYKYDSRSFLLIEFKASHVVFEYVFCFKENERLSRQIINGVMKNYQMKEIINFNKEKDDSRKYRYRSCYEVINVEMEDEMIRTMIKIGWMVINEMEVKGNANCVVCKRS